MLLFGKTPEGRVTGELLGALDRTVVVRLPVRCCKLVATLESHLLEGSMTVGGGGAATSGCADVLGCLSAAFDSSPSRRSVSDDLV